MKDGNIGEWKEPSIDSAWASAGPFDGPAAVLPAAESGAPRVWRALKRLLAQASAVCGAFEWLAFGYLGATSVLIVVFAENLAHPFRLLAVNSLAASVVLALCLVEARSATRRALHGPSLAARWWHFWRHWYPHLFFLFCFEELGQLMTLVTPHWQDAKLIAFDYWLTGVHPSVWLEQFATPLRNDVMQLIYFTYFTYLLIVGWVLYVRREWRGFWSVMTWSMAGYMIGYFVAIFFPIESPWFSMAGWWKAPLEGGPFTAMMGFIEHYGRVRGAAFPSAHVTGATAALWGAWKFRRWLFWVLLPLYVGMCFSTIWGRYHYCADVLGGMLTGTLGYLIGSWVMKRPAAITTAPGITSA
jgi:membrane-associated phospholipid phosphatase